MRRGVYLIRNSGQIPAFAGLILPNIVPRLEEANVFVIGAVEGQQAVGAAVLEILAAEARILSIAVAEEHRRQGIGSALLRQCVRVLRRTSIQSLSALILNEETAAAGLFASFGMECSAEAAAHYEITLGDPSLDALAGTVGKVLPLEEISDLRWRNYMLEAFPSDPGLNRREQFDPRVSQVWMDGGKITGCLLAETEGDRISLGWLSSKSGDPKVPIQLFRGALKAARESYPPDANVSFAAYDASVLRLADRLLGQSAEKTWIQSWNLSGYRFRLADTTPKGWEVL